MSAPAGVGASELPPPALEEERRFSLRMGKLAWTATTAVVALAASFSALAFDLFPWLKPDPAVEFEAVVQVVTVEHNVTWGDYLIRTGQSEMLKYATNGERKVTGNVFYVEQQTKGFKGDGTLLTWSLYDDKTKERLPDEGEESRGTKVIPARTSARVIVPVWEQPLRDPGKYFYRFELHSENVLLALVDSPAFSVANDDP